MPSDHADLGRRSGNLVESHTTFQPRVFFFYFLVVALLLTLAIGLARQQLLKTGSYSEAERVQNQRRVLVPGPRGNIYDRDGRLVVGNHPRFAVVLYLDELRPEFRKEYIQIRKNYREAGDKEGMPSSWQMERIARVSVVQRYLDQVCAIIGRKVELVPAKLVRHFSQELLLPFILVNDLAPDEYARLIEKLPVKSPLQVYTSSVRYYPFGRSAAHTLGFVSMNTDIDAEDMPGENLTTFKMKGAVGREGLEARFDSTLQGEPGGTIFRVDPAGYRINPPLAKKLPVQGTNITSSLDMDIQQVAEETLGDRTGAAVMMDVNTGEVLAMASKPDFADGAYLNRALSGLYPPGSSFKLLTSLAGFRKGVLQPDSSYRTDGTYIINRKVFRDHHGCITGDINFPLAIEQSVNTYFYHFGLQIGVEAIASEAERFGFTHRTGIELPHETGAMLIGTPAWKEKRKGEKWYPGDTANLAIGQGFIQVTPLQMCCFVASLARGQTHTTPTLLHDKNHPQQRSEPIGISAAQYKALLEGMERVTTQGTGKLARIEGLRSAGKTGTAQFRTPKGTLEFAWFVGFAPIDRPEVAWAILVEGDTPDESYGGGREAAPIAKYMLMKWLEKKQSATPGSKISSPD